MTGVYVKIGAALVLVMGLLATGYYFGGLKAAAALAKFEAAEAQQTAKAVLAERESARVEAEKINKALEEFLNAPIDPVVTGLAQRLYAHAAAECPVSAAGEPAGGVIISSPRPTSDPRVEQATQGVFDACEHDANQLNALIEAVK